MSVSCLAAAVDWGPFEVDLLKLRTREGVAIAKAKGKLKGKQPKLSTRQQAHLVKLHAAGEHTIAELAELFSVSRPTVYRSWNATAPQRPALPIDEPSCNLVRAR